MGLIRKVDLRLNRNMYKRRVLDNVTCCNCGYHKNIPFLDRDIEVHHTYDKSTYKRLKYDVNYMRTLCERCHTDFHTKWMNSFRESCTIWDYRKWRLYEEVVWFAWLRRIIGRFFK